MSARKTLSRLLPARNRAPASGARAVPSRRTAIFEALEPRLLLSADLAPQAESLLNQGLTQFATWAQTLGTVGELAT